MSWTAENQLRKSGSRISENRLVVFLLVSILLHWALIHAMPSMKHNPLETDLKRPIWVDLVDYTKAEEHEPTSTNPTVQNPQDTVQETPIHTQEVHSKRVAPKRDPLPEKHDPQESSSIMSDEVKDIPPVKDLIPSMQDLLSLQQYREDPFRALDLVPHQAGAGNHPAETLYEQYLLELKKKVERNWKVSLELGIREGITVIYVIVASDGSLFSCDILRPSGMIAHDYEAMEAVKLAFPLSPPPEELLNEKGVLPIRFSFHYLLAPPS
jgi:TonB family protein